MTDNKIIKWIFNSFYVVVVVIMLYLCSLLFYYTIEEKQLRYEITTQKTEIVSIDLQYENSGSFICGSGYIDTERYYVVYKVLDDGGKKLLKLPAEDTIIYNTLDSTDNAYLETDINGLGSIIALRVYVPENSIIEDYDFSL